MNINRISESRYALLAANYATKGQIVDEVVGRDLQNRTFDYALPQPWLDSMALKCVELNVKLPVEPKPCHVCGSLHTKETERGDYYDYILSRCVWDYPERSIFGQPLWLTTEAEAVMGLVVQALRS